MREVNVDKVTENIKEMCIEANHFLTDDMLITTEGIIIRLACRDISTLGRITSGVKLINLDDNVKVATVSKVRKSPSGDDGNETEEFDAESDSENIDGVNKVNENTSDSNTSDVADDSIDRLLDAANKDNQED